VDFELFKVDVQYLFKVDIEYRDIEHETFNLLNANCIVEFSYRDGMPVAEMNYNKIIIKSEEEEDEEKMSRS
jgi:hypothetical protein